MAFSIETILQNHGINGGSSGNLKIVFGDKFPITGLKDGLVFYHLVKEQFHVYIKGEWIYLGGKGLDEYHMKHLYELFETNFENYKIMRKIILKSMRWNIDGGIVTKERSRANFDGGTVLKKRDNSYLKGRSLKLRRK